MNARAKKIIFLLLAAALLASSGQLEKSLNRDRKQLGLTISEPLENAPPMLAFTTVALGGFRGLISNFLWIRSNDLQQDDKFFEASQLADWITDLEPHFAQVWVFQAWNMAYNISVKFKDFPDRWRWVERGVELLRDNGLRYNPDNTLIYQQLAWLFQHKMGANLDDANLYYKQQWAEEMTPFFGVNGTNIESLIHPQTSEDKTNAALLREKYKIDPVFAQKVDAQWGPFDWRLPETHAIYWYAMGLEKAEENPGKVKPDDLITLRRGIYQSEQAAFRHGRIIANPFTQGVELAPNLDLAAKANDSYLQMFAEETQPGMRDGILKAHRNFLRDAVYFLYENNRAADASKWFDYLGKNYPDKIILDQDPNSFPRNMTLDQYAVGRVQQDIGDTSQERTTSAVQGLLLHAFLDLAIGQDDRAAGFQSLAKKVYDRYQKEMGDVQVRTALPPFDNLKRTVLNQLLDTKQGLPFAARAVLRTQLGMPAETNAPTAVTISTNAIAPAVLSNTNIPASTNK
ncbi:MAG TPA: hypothetical protein VK769_05345 [Verrucomicrobiae bacterium]|nr:hypothetical protein [Verrucomicrobiae bacterium]